MCYKLPNRHPRVCGNDVEWYDYFMPSKLSVFIWTTVGSVIGGYVPTLWGGDFLSYSGVFFSGLGGILGVFFAVQLARMME